MKKTAVILFNLGGPDSKGSIRPFLMNFFTDPPIIRLPVPLRYLVAHFIAGRRSKNEADTGYAALGYRAPLLENTQAQAAALQDRLGEDHKVFVCMRYWHPMAGQVVREVKAYAPDRIVILPLYPQFSTTTTGSSLRVWRQACKSAGLDVPTGMTCCYPREIGFVNASARLLRQSYEAMIQKGSSRPRVLFSAHGLPEKVIAGGDPYQWQCEQSASEIAHATGIESLDWQICYQSKVGPLKWIGPSTTEALDKAAAAGLSVLIYAHAFVSDHIETLVEIDQEYAHYAKEKGIPHFARVPALGTDDTFIEGLAGMVRRQAEQISANGGTVICPAHFKRCCARENKIGTLKEAA